MPKELKAREILTEYWKAQFDPTPSPYDRSWLIDSYFDLHGISGQINSTKMLRAFREDVSFFFVFILGVTPWVHVEKGGQDQLSILEYAQSSRRYAVRSGHKVSKSNSVAGVALWWFTTREMARVPITSSSFFQVRMIIWYEIQNLYRDCIRRDMPIGGELYEDPSTGLKIPDGRQVFGFSTRDKEKAAGISGKNIYYLLDEASGIDEDIFEAVEGNRAGGAAIGMFSNPTRTVGTFYEAFHGKKAYWDTLHIPSYHTPNCQAGRIVVPGLATPEWVEEKRDEWGEGSPLFAIRVEGDFPAQGAMSVFPLDLIEASSERFKMARRLGHRPKGDLRIGVDPAISSEDEFAIAVVVGDTCKEIRTYYNKDGREKAKLILKAVRHHRTNRTERVPVTIDANGVGIDVVTSLNGEFAEACRELRIDVLPFMAQEKPMDTDKYVNRRAEAIYHLSDWIDSGGEIPEDNKLHAELAATEYDVNKKGLILILPKKKEKKELGHSPDRRDALALAVYNKHAHEFDYKGAGQRATHSAKMDRYMSGY
jgi:hypothetical protein